jgi:hypothetical protein
VRLMLLRNSVFVKAISIAIHCQLHWYFCLPNGELAQSVFIPYTFTPE